MRLWIDDLRDPVKYNYNDAYWCKNFIDSINFINKHEKEITKIHFDNDLGDEEGEGRTIFNMVEVLLYEGKLKKLKEIFIHTSNTAASKSMMSAKSIFDEMYNIKLIKNDYN